MVQSTRSSNEEETNWPLQEVFTLQGERHCTYYQQQGGELYGLVKPPFGSVKKRGQKVERSSRKAPRKPNMYIQLVTYCTVHKFAN